jgi:hypothetical protein
MMSQLVTPCRVSNLQRYGVTVRGNVTRVYLSLAVDSAVKRMFPPRPADTQHCLQLYQRNLYHSCYHVARPSPNLGNHKFKDVYKVEAVVTY